MNSGPPLQLFAVNLFHIPLFLVWIVGIVYAVKNWGKHPKISKLTSIALILFLLMTTLQNTMLPLLIRFLSSSQLGPVFLGIRIVSILLSTVLWIFVLVAIFSERGNPAGDEKISV